MKSELSADSFKQYLQSRKMTEEALLISLKNKLQVNAYLESRGVLHFEPTEEEILSFYEEKKESFKKEERAQVRHILIQVNSSANEEEKKAAKREKKNAKK